MEKFYVWFVAPAANWMLSPPVLPGIAEFWSQCCRPLGKKGAVNPSRGAQAGDIWSAAMVVLRILVYVWQTPPNTIFWMT